MTKAEGERTGQFQPPKAQDGALVPAQMGTPVDEGKTPADGNAGM